MGQITDSELFLQGVIQEELRILKEEQRKQKALEEQKIKTQLREERRQQKHLEKVKECCFDKYDKNNDGVLELSELKEYVRELCERTEMPMPDEVFLVCYLKVATTTKTKQSI